MIMGAWIWGVTAGLLLVELVAGRAREMLGRRELTLNTLTAVVNAGVMRPLNAMLIAYLLKLLAPGHAGALAHVPVWIGFPVTLVVVEFCFYWVHRWAHLGQSRPQLNWLWRLHHTHHSADYMSVVLTLRQNIFWSFVVPTSLLLGLATYWGQGPAAMLTIMTIYGWNLITHWNFRWDDKLRRTPLVGRGLWWVEHVLVSPGIHHTHHGYGRDGAMYRNFAVTLSALDWAFGTLHIPKGRPARYGVPGEKLRVVEDVFYPLAPRRQVRPRPVVAN